MWVVVLVAHQDAFASPAHSMFLVVVVQALESGDHTGVLLRLGLFDTERVV